MIEAEEVLVPVALVEFLLGLLFGSLAAGALRAVLGVEPEPLDEGGFFGVGVVVDIVVQ